jgi:hypothetical protein
LEFERIPFKYFEQKVTILSTSKSTIDLQSFPKLSNAENLPLMPNMLNDNKKSILVNKV